VSDVRSVREAVATPRQFGFDLEHFSSPQPVHRALERRISGRYPVDEYGLDPQLCDLLLLVARGALHVQVEGGERIPREGPAVLVANRGLGVLEPFVLGVAVAAISGRRLRAVGAFGRGPLRGLWRRLGAVGGNPVDLRGLLRMGHLVSVPLGPTWLRTQAGPPRLELCAAMLGYTVHPVAISQAGPFPTGIGPLWSVRVGAHVALDDTYERGDPLGAAELGEAARDAVQAMLAGGDPSETPLRPDLAGTGA
jgi:hypothetical protein